MQGLQDAKAPSGEITFRRKKEITQLKGGEIAYIDMPSIFSVSDTKTFIDTMQDAHHIVIREQTITIVISHPLSRPAEFKVSAPRASGFTRAEIARKICDLYRQVYSEEDRTKTQQEGRDIFIPRKLEDHAFIRLNRGLSDGKYGINMYNMCDLILRSVTKGDDKYYLGIESRKPFNRASLLHLYPNGEFRSSSRSAPCIFPTKEPPPDTILLNY
jgi:hypothetical protein